MIVSTSEKEKFSSASDLIKRLSYVIYGHEFITPLTTILGISELLKEGGIPQDQKLKCYEYIHDCGNRLNRLTERIQLWYKLQFENKHKKKIEVVNLKLIKKIVSEVKGSQKRHLSIKADATTYSFISHPLLTEVIFFELLENAYKYSPSDKPIEIKLFQNEDLVFFECTNYTIISEHNYFKEYEAFIQYERRYFEQQGLGLGLALVKLSIEKIGGEFYVFSEDRAEGECLTFQVQFKKAK